MRLLRMLLRDISNCPACLNLEGIQDKMKGAAIT